MKGYDSCHGYQHHDDKRSGIKLPYLSLLTSFGVVAVLEVEVVAAALVVILLLSVPLVVPVLLPELYKY